MNYTAGEQNNFADNQGLGRLGAAAKVLILSGAAEIIAAGSLVETSVVKGDLPLEFGGAGLASMLVGKRLLTIAGRRRPASDNIE